MSFSIFGLAFENWKIVGFDFANLGVFIAFAIVNLSYNSILKIFNITKEKDSFIMFFMITWLLAFVIIATLVILEKYTNPNFSIVELIIYLIVAPAFVSFFAFFTKRKESNKKDK